MPRKDAKDAKDSSPVAASPPSLSAASLRTLRQQIDKLDMEILKKVNERATLAGQIGKVKTENGEEVFSPAREEEVLHNMLQANEKGKGPLTSECIRAIYREIMSGSRALQKVLRVSYLGPRTVLATWRPWIDSVSRST